MCDRPRRLAFLLQRQNDCDYDSYAALSALDDRIHDWALYYAALLCGPTRHSQCCFGGKGLYSLPTAPSTRMQQADFVNFQSDTD